MSVERGQTLSHYRLIEKIGEGGMGVVWKAEDTVLGRTVAIKVLPTDAARDQKRRRMFLEEARLAASLGDPHVVQVHDFGRQGDLDFIVMELVEGVPLGNLLHGKPLPPERVAEIGYQVARALSKAHHSGLIHRDLKPANILITTKGEAKVVDFGLATLFEPPVPTSGSDAPTRTLVDAPVALQKQVAGTLPYMSPEQVRGDKLDSRSDIFSLGIVLYQMTTGRLPFRGATHGEVASAILNSRPQPAHVLVPHIPLDLDRILARALAHRPADRYQDTEDLAVELRQLSREMEAGSFPSYEDLEKGKRPARRRHVGRWIGVSLIAALAVAGYWFLDRLLSPPAASPGKIMLAVLPFANISGDPGQEFFSDGMTEEMIAQLARLNPRQLGVIARTSAMHYKNSDKNAEQIGKELSVHYLLEGSVRRDGNRVRITAQLIEVKDQTHVWAGNYDGDLTNILGLQSEVARAIAEEIQIQLGARESGTGRDTRPFDPEAYEAYLKGRYHWNSRSREGMTRGIEYFNRAIELEPRFGLAYAGLADSYVMLAAYDLARPEEAFPKAKSAATRALEIDDSLSEAQVSLAYAEFLHEWDWEKSGSRFRQALELNPSYALGHQWYAVYLVGMGRQEEAMREARLAQQFDPLSPIVGAVRAWILYLAGEYDQAIEQSSRTLDLNPEFFVAYLFLGRAFEQKNMLEEAIAAFQSATEFSDGRIGVRIDLGHGYALAGMRSESMEILHEMEQTSKRQYVPAFSFALLYNALGEKELAFQYLDRAFEERYPWLTLLGIHPRMKNLNSDPRFQEFLRRMDFPD